MENKLKNLGRLAIVGATLATLSGCAQIKKDLRSNWDKQVEDFRSMINRECYILDQDGNYIPCNGKENYEVGI